MPIENEIKMVLHQSADLERKVAQASDNIYHIKQGYLNSSGRIRYQRCRTNVKRVFTFKQQVDNNVIEIEKKISEFDYDELSKVAKNWVSKTRYVIDGCEID